MLRRPHRIAARLLENLHIRIMALCLVLYLAGFVSGSVGCAASPASQNAGAIASASSATTQLVDDFRNTDLGATLKHSGSMELQYARCYTLDIYEGGYVLVCMADGNRYLVVPEGAQPPADLPKDVVVLNQPAGNVYLAASDTLCLFDALDALDCISVSGIERDDWYLPAMQSAMDEGKVVYGGKYRAPDYELLLSRNVRLALESTMINHAPDVREKLVELGIPVLVEMSSYESEPLGRAEWIKLYGILCNKQDQAQKVFQQQVDQVSAASGQPTGKSMAYFYLNASGAAVVRKPGDYVTKMIEQAGGTYAFGSVDKATAGSSTTTMQMEQFFAAAKDADVMVYNSSIDEGVRTMDDLLQKSQMLKECKAVRNGNVWVTDQNMYQQMLNAGGIISDFRHVLEGSDESLVYLRRLLPLNKDQEP